MLNSSLILTPHPLLPAATSAIRGGFPFPLSPAQLTTTYPLVAMNGPDENPKVVCGSVLTVEAGGGGDGALGSGERLFVLGRRTIHPRRGCWGIPAGLRVCLTLRLSRSTSERAPPCVDLSDALERARP